MSLHRLNDLPIDKRGVGRISQFADRDSPDGFVPRHPGCKWESSYSFWPERFVLISLGSF
jgi:hypothetical protein